MFSFFTLPQIQNLGIFSVQDLLFRADLWSVTLQGNQLVNITDCSVEQVTDQRFCWYQVLSAG